MTKQALIQALNEMPENISVDELMEKAVLLEKVEKGIAQSDLNNTVSHEDARQRLSKWLR